MVLQQCNRPENDIRVSEQPISNRYTWLIVIDHYGGMISAVPTPSADTESSLAFIVKLSVAYAKA